ncbi:hypothetical protein [Microbacterium xylanilyticum]
MATYKINEGYPDEKTVTALFPKEINGFFYFHEEAVDDLSKIVYIIPSTGVRSIERISS